MGAQDERWRGAARLAGNIQSQTGLWAQRALDGSRARVAALDHLIALQGAKMARTRAQISDMLARRSDPPAQLRTLPQPRRHTPLVPTPFASSAVQQGRAGVSGAVDAFTMGAADPVTSAVRATFTPGANAWIDRYGANMRVAQAQDQYDAQAYPVARMVGQGVGTVGAVAALGATGLAAAGAVGRLAPTAGRLVPQVGHVLRVAGATGAGAGIAGQSISDLASGRLSPVTDYVGAGVGGGIGGLSAPYVGATQGGAIAGGAIPAAQAIFSGRLPSVDEVSQGAVGGALFGSIVGGIGAKRAGDLSVHAKGRLGEQLSRANTYLRGEIPSPIKAKPRVVLEGGSRRNGYIVPDQQTNTGRLVEAKFGERAGLSRNQMRAIKEGVPLNVESWLDRDIAAVFGVGSAAARPDQAADLAASRVRRKERP